MKTAFAALALVALFALSASAAEVSSGTLQKMGYGNSRAMNDTEGLAVRGKAVYIVGANAINIGGAAAIGYGQVKINAPPPKIKFSFVQIP